MIPGLPPRTAPDAPARRARSPEGGSPRRHRAWLLGLATLAAGCSEELGPEHLPTVRVSGVVVEAGVPVGGGWIEFLPVDGTVGKLRSAPLGRDGRFEAEGVAVGRNLVGLVNPPLNSVAARFFNTFNSPIRREISPTASGPLIIDLAEEARRVNPPPAPGG